MAETQIFYIATSNTKEVRKGGSVTFEWNIPSKPTWKNFKNPPMPTKKKVKWEKSTKTKPNTAKGGSWITTPSGGITKYGSFIPHTATRVIDGVSRSCEVKYKMRGRIIYKKPAQLKKTENKMYKQTWTNSNPYQYALMYKEKPVIDEDYCEYIDGKEFIYFSTYYVDDNGQNIPTTAHLPHPTKSALKYSDCRRNFESSANNSDGRDNHGSYVMSNVRANIATLELEWTGLSSTEGADLINTLNPDKNSSGQYPYLIVQYLDPRSNSTKNGTFYAGERSIEKYANGIFKTISVTLTEV